MTSTSWEFFDAPTSGHNKLHMKLLSTNLALSTHIPCIFRPSHLWSASVYQCSSPLRSLGSHFWWTHEPKLKRNDALRKWWFFSFTKYVCMNFAIQAVTWILNPFKNASHCLKALIFRPISQHALYRMYDTPQWTFKTWAADRISFRLFGFTVLCWNFRLRDLHHIFIGLYLRVLSDNITHQRMKDRKRGDGYNGCKIYLKFESKIKCTLYLQERNMAFKIQTILWLKQFLNYS